MASAWGNSCAQCRPLLTQDSDFTALLSLRARYSLTLKSTNFLKGKALFMLPTRAGATNRIAATGLVAHDFRELLSNEVTGRETLWRFLYLLWRVLFIGWQIFEQIPSRLT